MLLRKPSCALCEYSCEHHILLESRTGRIVSRRCHRIESMLSYQTVASNHWPGRYVYFSGVRKREDCHIDQLGIRVKYNRVEFVCSALEFCRVYNATVTVAILLGKTLL